MIIHISENLSLSETKSGYLLKTIPTPKQKPDVPATYYSYRTAEYGQFHTRQQL